MLKGTAKEEEERAFASKQGRLQLAQVLGLDQPEEKDPKKKEKESESKGWGEQIAMKIVDNMQIFIDKIHVRYEDSQSVPGNPFAFGITLDHIHVQSTDYSWKPGNCNLN